MLRETVLSDSWAEIQIVLIICDCLGAKYVFLSQSKNPVVISISTAGKIIGVDKSIPRVSGNSIAAIANKAAVSSKRASSVDTSASPCVMPAL